MALNNNLYSRFVVWTKIILPVIALGVLSSLFLFSKSYDPTLGVTYSDQELLALSTREGINKPRFAGTTSEGISVSLSAENVGPGGDDGAAVTAAKMRAAIEMPDGSSLKIVANSGWIHEDQKSAEMSGGIFLETSIGYTAVTEGLRFQLDDFHISSMGAIAATSPYGDVSAGEMIVSYEEKDGIGGYVLVFQKEVMLVYTPNQEGQEE